VESWSSSWRGIEAEEGAGTGKVGVRCEEKEEAAMQAAEGSAPKMQKARQFSGAGQSKPRISTCIRVADEAFRAVEVSGRRYTE
jgi:hypothetical protein